jgi:phage tail sheath protein FI
VSISYTYPGVYIQELPSQTHSITGVATSIAAFVGYTPSGIDNRAQVIFSFADFQRLFGGLAADSELSYAVQQFYLNGGSQAYVVRVPRDGAVGASVSFDDLEFTALSSGSWANGQLLIDVDVQNINLTPAPSGDPLGFNLTITDLLHQTTESFPGVTLNPGSRNYVTTVLNDPDNGSQLVNVALTGTPGGAPAVTGIVGTTITTATVNNALGGSDTATAVMAADAKVGDNYVGFGLVLSTSAPAPPATPPPPLPVTVFGQGTPIPQSLSGLATQLQQAINNALTVPMPGASVQCSVSQVVQGPSWPATSWAIRVNATLPQQPDAVLTFGTPDPAATGLADAATALGLAAPVTSNVAHYALGTGHTSADQPSYGSQTASVAGGDGTGLPSNNGPDGQSGLIGNPAQFTGIYALQKVDLFNLLSIPDATRALPSNPASLDTGLNPPALYSAAIALCDQRRAFLLVDPPPTVTTVAAAVDWKSQQIGITDPNGAAFWPRLRLPDALNQNNLRTFAPSGAVAGVYATIDGSSGVWKAPAGISATLNGVQSTTYQLSDPENGLLNPLGLNCFRTFPSYRSVIWGARTLAGADALASQWKYVPVRRMALFLEESLYRGTQWVVFEPNDEPLWASIRLNVNSFMQTYFQKQAFQGQTPDEAYFVKCDSETTTQTDIGNGIVNILVGFAPLQPAEFVVIQIEQLTGQAQS